MTRTPPRLPCREPLTCGEEASRLYGGMVLRCLRCGLHRTAREPDFDYGDAYFTTEGDGGYDFESAFSVARDRLRFERELAALEKRGPFESVLDVGCATGSFLRIAAERGWEVAGVEPARYAAAVTEERIGAPVPASTRDLPEGRTYDVVTLHHVLEHIHDPVTFLREEVAPRARHRVLVEVPNFDSLPSRVHGQRWRDLRLDQHVFHYTASTLEMIVRAAGQEPVRTYTLWDPLWTARSAWEMVTLLSSSALHPRRRETVGTTLRPLNVRDVETFTPPAGWRKLLGTGSRIALWPSVRLLEGLGLGPRLVVEARPAGGTAGDPEQGPPAGAEPTTP